MAIWNVEFSYNIEVEANTKEEAEASAEEEWFELEPRLDEMNIKVSKID